MIFDGVGADPLSIARCTLLAMKSAIFQKIVLLTSVVWGVALSRDGRLVASGGIDGLVKLWEAGTGFSLRTLRAERRYERLDITGLTGVTEAQRSALLALGAVERGS